MKRFFSRFPSVIIGQKPLPRITPPEPIEFDTETEKILDDLRGAKSTEEVSRLRAELRRRVADGKARRIDNKPSGKIILP